MSSPSTGMTYYMCMQMFVSKLSLSSVCQVFKCNNQCLFCWLNMVCTVLEHATSMVCRIIYITGKY